jgi:diaminopimelate decarboxylase
MAGGRQTPSDLTTVDNAAKADESAEAGESIDCMVDAGRLAGLAPESLARVFGTPFYVYDLDMIGRRVEALRSILPSGFRIAFAVKSNPSLAVIGHLRRCGVGADVASGGELAAVLRVGFAPADVAMTGPGKRDEELEAAIGAGIGAITVESVGELRRLEAIARRAARRQPVLLRLTVSDEARLESVRLIGGVEGKFGMPLSTLKEAARLAAASPHLELLGLHAFGASNLRNVDLLVGHIAQLMDIAREVTTEVGVPLRLVDAGGGLGIPYADGDEPLDLELLGRRLQTLRVRWNEIPELQETEVLLEPGRFLVGPAGAYVARVVDVKGPDSAPVAILDGGINHAVRPALVRTEHRLAVLATDQIRALVPVTVAGPLCTGIDVFATGACLPRPRVGDLVAVLDMGAYGFTESMPWFLSHPTAAEVAVKGGVARLIRPHVDPVEMLERQIEPDWQS